jgi:hypothetical protein
MKHVFSFFLALLVTCLVVTAQNIPTPQQHFGFAIGDEQMMKKAHPLKYTFNVIPGLYQATNEVLPYVFPEVSKDLGIIVSSASRQQ